jgi:hypothetical protein
MGGVAKVVRSLTGRPFLPTRRLFARALRPTGELGWLEESRATLAFYAGYRLSDPSLALHAPSIAPAIVYVGLRRAQAKGWHGSGTRGGELRATGYGLSLRSFRSDAWFLIVSVRPCFRVNLWKSRRRVGLATSPDALRS